MSNRICPGCRSLSDEHNFKSGECTLAGAYGGVDGIMSHNNKVVGPIQRNRQLKEDEFDLGWTVDYRQLEEILSVVNNGGVHMSLEDVEAVALAMFNLGYLFFEEDNA